MATQRKNSNVVNCPGIRGFEAFPQGKLLAQKVEFDGPIGIAYERCIGYTKPEHSHDRVTITFPRGSSRSFIKVFPENKNFNLNEDSVHVMAQNHLHEQGTKSSIYDTFALFVTQDYLEAYLKKLGAKNDEVAKFVRSTQEFSKTAILKDLVDRYFFCRVLEESPSDVELSHLESLILTELFTLGRKRNLKGTVHSASSNLPSERRGLSDETALVRAVEFIESHLFEKLDVQALVRSARTSQATLFRLFKKEIKLSPLEYVRNRRLDEAEILLKAGQYQVGDVALLVGYEDLSSFSKAFKTRFGSSPSKHT